MNMRYVVQNNVWVNVDKVICDKILECAIMCDDQVRYWGKVLQCEHCWQDIRTAGKVYFQGHEGHVLHLIIHIVNFEAAISSIGDGDAYYWNIWIKND